MRHIGNLPDEKQARAFGDFLTATAIRHELEPDTDGSWMLWIREEDQIAEAQAALANFRATPDAPQYRHAEQGAARARAAEAEDLAAYQRRVKTGRNVFTRLGGYGIGVLTYALIFACLISAFYTQLGKNRDVARQFMISDPEGASREFLPEVRTGEVWRLFTPIFLHLGIMHLLFNMMWLFQLGCMIEGRQSARYLAALVLGTALLSNLAQYQHHGPGFGGMSGVVYGLAGYAWIRGKYDRASGVGLESQSVTMLLIWLVVCYSGFVGPVANTAHLVGLLTGMAWGRVAALRKN